MRVLVTGCMGFVGNVLCRKLHGLGYTVSGLAKHSSRSPDILKGFQGIDIHWCDLLNQDAVDKAIDSCDVVIHCAAVLPGHEDPDIVWKVNVLGTKNVVNACIKHNCKRLVYISSDSVYGDGPTDNATEQQPIDTQYFKEGIYPQSKLEGERLVMEASVNHGLPYVILRPCMIYGPGLSPSTEVFLQWIGNGIKFLLGGGKSRLSILYVDDFADAIITASIIDASIGECYNISDGRTYSKLDMLRHIKWISGKPKYIIPIPAWLAHAGFFVAKRFCKICCPDYSDYFDHRKIFFATQDHTISCHKAQVELNYQPKVLMPEGVSTTLDWIRQSI